MAFSSLCVNIHMNPVPQPRHQVGKHGNAYHPKHVSRRLATYKAVIIEEIRRKCGDGFKAGKGQPVSMVVIFSMPMAKSWSKFKRERYRWRPHFAKPDLDNLVKTVKDALVPDVLYDDSQVATLEATKLWAEEGSVYIVLKKLEEGESNEQA